MGQVISLSAPALDMMLYGEKSRGMGTYLMNQIQNVAPAFNEFSQRIYNALQNSYNYVTNQMLQYGIKSELQQAGLSYVDNYYQPLTSYTELQNANLTMQRWVMAHPEVKQLYVDQNIDGYSGSYENVWGKGVGDKDYNFRKVMDGVVKSTDDGYEIKWYLEDDLPGDKELDAFERTQVLRTWNAIDWMLENCEFDFTHVGDKPTKINR